MCPRGSCVVPAAFLEDTSCSCSSDTIAATIEEGISPPTKPTHRKHRSSVSFGSVEIREFNRIVGDHPDCKLGPPLGIDWQYIQRQQVPVDDFEQSPRHGLYPLDTHLRKEILQFGFGVPEEEIIQAEKEVEKAARLREKTRQQLKISKRTQALIKAATRIFQRGSSQKTTAANTTCISTTDLSVNTLAKASKSPVYAGGS